MPLLVTIRLPLQITNKILLLKTYRAMKKIALYVKKNSLLLVLYNMILKINVNQDIYVCLYSTCGTSKKLWEQTLSKIWEMNIELPFFFWEIEIKDKEIYNPLQFSLKIDSTKAWLPIISQYNWCLKLEYELYLFFNIETKKIA